MNNSIVAPVVPPAGQGPMPSDDVRVWVDFVLGQAAQSWIRHDPADLKSLSARSIPHSDLYAAEIISQTFSGRIAYVPASDEWRIWNGVYHELFDGERVLHWLCKSFAQHHAWALRKVKTLFEAEAPTLTGDQKKTLWTQYNKLQFGEHRAYRDRVHMTGGIQGLMNEVKRCLSVSDTYFVNDRQWLVVENGVIDLWALQNNPPQDISGIVLLDHDPARPVWRSVAASFDPNADHRRWTAFLDSSQPDPELQKFLSVTTGAAYAAASKTKVIPVLDGPKDSGKTVFIDTIATLGGGYAAQPDGSAILKSGHQNFEQDELRGMRFVGISEPDTSQKVDDSFLKKFTGGDVLSTRTLYSKSVPWKSQGIVFFATNTDLKFPTTDKALVDRFATVMFPNAFYPKGKAPAGKEAFVKDKTLEFALQQEHDGILNWVLRGMLDYFTDGIEIPDVIEQHRGKQYAEGSSVHIWADEVLKANQGTYVLDSTDRPASHWAKVSDLHSQYVDWMITNGEGRYEARPTFSKQLTRYLGLDTKQSNGFRVVGIVSTEHLPAF